MLGLDIADIIVICAYFGMVIFIGFWAMRRISNQEDYFLAGRKFGKFIQTFAAFGQATSTDSAIGVSTTTFKNGAAGIWSTLNILFATPIYWITSPWYRRMRMLTLGDFFEERYRSKPLAGFYAIVQAINFMLILSVSFNAIGKTALVLTPKSPDQFTPTQQQEYERAMELETLEARDYTTLSDTEISKLKELRLEEPRKVFSHLNKSMLVIVICIVVLLYAVAGGLEAAFLTDTIQGIGIILLSVLLIPFALVKVNSIYGTSGVFEPFRIMHDKLPESFFEIMGSPSNLDFTWYYVLTIMLMVTLNVMPQANQMTATGSAKGEYEARFGFTLGLYLKRICTLLWGLIALFAVLLYSDAVTDPDMVWGYASRDLLGAFNVGLVGLMLACLLAALMSTADCLMITASSLLTHNIYRIVWPGRSEKHYVDIGRVFGAVVIIGGALISLSFTSLLTQMKLSWEFGIIFAAPFWLGILWRRTNAKAVWISAGLTTLLFFVIPIVTPVVMPGLRTDAYLLKTTQPQVLEREYTARAMDVAQRQEMIDNWEGLLAQGLVTGTAPAPLAEGEKFSKKYTHPEKAIFWTQGIRIDEQGQAHGKGMLNVALLMYDKMGMDLAKNPYAFNETIRIITRILFPFLMVILISKLTKPVDKKSLDLFYVKMKTKVQIDRDKDAEEMRLSNENPQRFDHLKMFPNSDWELTKWDKTDITGFSISLAIAFGVIGLFYLMVNIGS